MTAEPLLPPITCPSSLVAACAPLLGFVPEKSLVAFIHGVPGRVSPVIMRVDLPPDGHAAAAAAQTALSIDGTGGVAVDWVAWVDDHDSTSRDDLSSARFLHELRQALDLVGIEVGGNLSTNGRMWWSHTCNEPECCPSQGTQLDAGIMNSVRAEYVYAGYAPLPSRDDLTARITRDEGRVLKVQQALAPAATRPVHPAVARCAGQVPHGVVPAEELLRCPGDPDDARSNGAGWSGPWTTSGFATSSSTGWSFGATTAIDAGRARSRPCAMRCEPCPRA